MDMYRRKANSHKIEELLRMFSPRFLSRFGHRLPKEVIAGLNLNGDDLTVIGRFQVVLQALSIKLFALSNQPFLIYYCRDAHGLSCFKAFLKASDTSL